MALQTFFIGNFIAENMALRAIRDPLQMGMGIGQFTR
jgi:hypothetical protein